LNKTQRWLLDGGNGGAGKVTGAFSVLLAPIGVTARPLGADTLDALLERGLSFDRAGTKTIPLVHSMLTPDGVHVGDPQLRNQLAHFSTAPS